MVQSQITPYCRKRRALYAPFKLAGHSLDCWDVLASDRESAIMKQFHQASHFAAEADRFRERLKKLRISGVRSPRPYKKLFSEYLRYKTSEYLELAQPLPGDLTQVDQYRQAERFARRLRGLFMLTEVWAHGPVLREVLQGMKLNRYNLANPVDPPGQDAYSGRTRLTDYTPARLI